MINVALSEISKTITSGLTPLRSNAEFWKNKNIPWLKTEQLGEKYIYDTNEYISQNALDATSIKINKKNTLSIAMYGEGKTRGSVSVLKNEMTTNQACCNVYLDEDKADYEYIYYYLKTQYKNLRNLSSGVRKNLNSNDIKNFKINMPVKLKGQQKIANILSLLDEKIRLNNEINDQLEAMAKTFYNYWFVQFDFPDSHGKPYKSTGGKMVYNQELKREIPEGWDCIHLEEVLEFGKGVEPGADNYETSKLNKDYIPFFRVANMDGNITTFVHNSLVASSLVKEDDILVSFDGTVGKIAIGLNGSYSTGMKKIYERNGFFPKVFVYEVFKSDEIQQIIKKYATGSIILHASSSIKNLKIPYNETSVREFNTLLSNNFKKIVLNIKQNQELSKLRDWLLPMLMNGQVSVK